MHWTAMVKHLQIEAIPYHIYEKRLFYNFQHPFFTRTHDHELKTSDATHMIAMYQPPRSPRPAVCRLNGDRYLR
jgi:hypothetical protein